MEQKIKLKPCPLCGNTDIKAALINPEYKGTEREEEFCFWFVGCPKCRALGTTGKTEAEAVEKWNQGVKLKEEATVAKYIDANKLKEELTRTGTIGDFGLYLIDIQPAADVQEVKHGKWEKINPNLCSICVMGETAWKCSVCKHKYVTSGDYDVGLNYCPDCGAKMDGKDGE